MKKTLSKKKVVEGIKITRVCQNLKDDQDWLIKKAIF